MSNVTSASDDGMLRYPADNRRYSASRADGEKCATGHELVDHQASHGNYATGGAKYIQLRKRHRIATWNVRGMRQTGKLCIVENELRRCNIDICGLTETHWHGNGHYKSTNYSVYFSGNENKSSEGIAFVVSNKLSPAVMGYEAVNERIMSIKINGTPCRLNILLVYAPTTAATDEEIDIFYRTLETHVKKVPSKELSMIIGDFNAKVGDTTNDLHLRSVVGRHGLGMRNERGESLIQFCIENNFSICNTNYEQHKRRLYTWRSPDGKTKNQIDYILINTRWRSSVLNTKTLPSADCGSDHQLLVSECRIRFKVCKCAKPNVELTRNLPQDDTIDQTLWTRLQQETLQNETVETFWTKLKTAVTDTVRELTPRFTTRKKQPWISDETLDLCLARREMKKDGLNSIEEQTRYNELCGLIQRGCRKDKHVYYNNICQEIETHSNANQSRDLFQKIKTITRSFKPKSYATTDKNGVLKTELDQVLEIWREYCESLYNDDTAITAIASNTLEPAILLCEVKEAVRNLNNNKAVGFDGIAAEIWKHMDEHCLPTLQNLCQMIWETGQWPCDWSTSVIIPLHKKGNKHNCDNYRLIALISHASKIMLHIIHSRLQRFTTFQISPEQAGFVKGRGTREQILNVRILIEKAREHYSPLYLCFVDYTKAFDNVIWTRMWDVLLDMGVPTHLVMLIQNLYANSKAVIKMDNSLSGEALVKKGVRQGCVLSPLLFNLYSEHLMRIVLEGWDGGFVVGGHKISNLRYADDTLLVASNEEELTMFLKKLESVSLRYGLQINYKKTKIMIINREQEGAPQPHKVANCEVVGKIVYLGSIITSNGDCEPEIRRRIQLGKTAMSQLTRVWKDRNISIQTKKALVKSLVFSVFWYASETWVIKAADRRRIDAFEMWCWRRMLRIPWTARRTNASILKQVRIEHRLSSQTSARALRFFGHIIRHDNVERLIVQGMPFGKRRRGRSPTRWTDTVRNLTGLNLETATREANSRQRWQQVIGHVLNRLDNDRNSQQPPHIMYDVMD